MSFLVPSLLLGVLAAAIPVVIHLLHRQRTTPVPWGAMQFLLESPLRFKRRRKVDNWILLLARMALLGLLGFLLARPLMIEGRYSPLSSNVATDIAVVVDHSLSSGRKAARPADAPADPSATGGSVFDRSLAVVDDVARLMKPSDTLSVVLAEHRPDTSFTPLPVRSANVRDVQERLRRLKPGMTAASIADAVQAAREVIGRGPNAQKLIVVVSDGQRNAWQIDNHAAWAAATGDRSGAGAPKVYSLPVAPAANLPDIAVGDVKIEPTLVGLNRPAQLTATLTRTAGASGAGGAGPGAVTGNGGAVSVSLVVNGKPVEKRPVAGLAPGEARTVRFDYAFTQPGSNWVRIQADAGDALPADDAAVAAATVWNRLPVLVIDGQLTTAGPFRSSQFLVAAMQPVAEAAQEATALVQPKVVSASAAEGEKLDDFAAVVVNDVPALSGGAAEKLAAYARAGGGVWLILGPRSDPALIGSQLARAGLLTAKVREKRSAGATGAAPAVELKAPLNPMVALLAAAEHNALTGTVTRQWWAVTPGDGDEQVVLATAGGADPLVYERPVGRNGGRVVVWCTSADGAWNNWPLVPNFVPLVNETVYHLAGAWTRSAGTGRLDAGSPLEWSGPAQPRVKSASITRPDGTVVTRQPTLSNGRQRLNYNDTAEPGLYTLRFDPTEVPQPAYYGVSIDRRELDPAPLSEADDAWLKSRGFIERRITRDELASALGGVNKGVELWKWLGLGVLALLVFETLMTRRMIRLQDGRADGTGTLSGAHA